MEHVDEGIQKNARRLLAAGFMAILAAGVGFGVRGGLFNVWATTFNLNGTQLGNISLGAAFISFCFGIIIGGVIVDKIGYGKLVVVAFGLHLVSAFVTFAAKPGMDTNTAYLFLYWGTFLFGLANGTLEAVANPLVATLFPENRNHYLNLLHASWPAGMVIGGMIGWFLGGNLGWSWKAQLALYLVPTLIYGAMFLGQRFPKSEASSKGLKLGDMFKDVGILGAAVVCSLLFFFLKRDVFTPLFDNATAATAVSGVIAVGFLASVAVITKFAIGHWLLFVLFILHAMIGSLELGTDGWIQNITGTILTEQEGKILFVITSLVMFALRFCAHFIEKNLKLSPVGILFVCSVLACIGLNLVSGVSAFGPAVGALLVYAVGKTFFWPTMLAVASDRFPRTGAIAISLMGGIGMLSVGLLGGPGLGYARDRFSANQLEEADAQVYAEWKGQGAPSKWLRFAEVQPIDPVRLDEAKKVVAAKNAVEAGKANDELKEVASTLTEAQQTVVAADIRGNRRLLKVDSLIPAVMALGYLLLLLYFKTIGGYKPVHITREQIAGGVQGPMEA